MAGLGHEKVGHTGQGLWHHKGWQLPAYIQHVANDLIASGHSESRAVEMAVGIVKNWAAGHDGHGHAVHPDTQTKAAAAVAEWEALKAAASKKSSRRAGMADTKKPYGDVEYADPGYLDADGNQASKSGKPGVKRYPITADKVQAAWSYINQEKNASQYTSEQLAAIKGRIKSAMAKHGHEVSSDQGSRAALLMPYVRAFTLDDISIRSGGDGRTVDAYATVFDQPAEIHDQDGDYEEINDRAMYNKAVSDAAPAGSRQSWRVGVFYNHGMTLYQTPSDLYSMPCGTPVDIRPDGRGLFTSTRYARGQLGDLIIDGIREGLLTTYSVSGRYLRSSPSVPRFGFSRRADGSLPQVRRLEATLREYGPTPFPAYAGAEIVGMRAEWMSLLSSMLRSGTPPEPPNVDTSSDEEAVTDEPPYFEHSIRSPKEELQARRAQFLIRHRKD
jgi:hypothetical protein